MTNVGTAHQEHGRAPGLDVPHPGSEGACGVPAGGTGKDVADAARGNAQAVGQVRRIYVAENGHVVDRREPEDADKVFDVPANYRRPLGGWQ